MPVRNPYADLRALLDVTRRLTPEEMAELQLEQGYVDRALSIYDELTRRDPHNASYATRRAWLARMASVRPVRRIGERASEAPLDSAEPRERRATLNGVGDWCQTTPVGNQRATGPDRRSDRRVDAEHRRGGTGGEAGLFDTSLPGPRESTERTAALGAPADVEPAVVRALRIVRVR